MTEKTLADLREPFPPTAVGLLPKPYRKDSEREHCQLCNSYHGMPAAHIDYVGHAAVTDRLLTVDPGWTWEPVAFGPDGLPAYDTKGGLWTRLTVLGLTRLGYGDGPDPKQRIGDAIRNAAMRFGVALDLWTKNELESSNPNGNGESVSATADSAPEPAPDGEPLRSAYEFLRALSVCTSMAALTGLQRDAGLAGVLPDLVVVQTADGELSMPLGEAFARRSARLQQNGQPA